MNHKYDVCFETLKSDIEKYKIRVTRCKKAYDTLIDKESSYGKSILFLYNTNKNILNELKRSLLLYKETTQ